MKSSKELTFEWLKERSAFLLDQISLIDVSRGTGFALLALAVAIKEKKENQEND